MPVDVSIYSNLLRPPKSALEYGQEMDQSDLARSQLAGQRLNLIGQQQDYQDTQKLRELYAKPGFDPNDPNNLSSIFAISPKAGAAAQKAALDARKTTAEIGHLGAQTDNQTALAGKTRTEDTAAQFDLGQKKLTLAMQIVTSARDPATAHQQFQAAVQQGLMTPAEAAQKEQEVPTDPAGFQQWRSQSMDALIKAGDRLNLAMEQAKLTETTRNHKATEGLTAQGQRFENDRSAANRTKDYKVAGLDANGNDVAGDTSLSPAAIENAAARYNVDGTMPTNIGRGAQGARDLRKIQNRAAELALGVDPTQVRVNQLDAKSASGALTQITKAKTMAGAFEQTANANADLALSLSKKNDRTGIPMLNAGLQAWRTGTGSPEATQFAAANETFVNEYAKIMSGGMGNGPVSDSARNKAHDLLTTAMTPQQYEGNVKLLQREMRNRMKGFEDQEAAVRKRIGGGGAAAPSGAAGGTVPADIQALLDKHKGP